MTIDIRASISCSLGEVISGGIGDDYIQGNGLIKTTGSVLIDGLITPNIGTIVTFSYTKNGVTRSIPRKLRVKSSFADPFRRTTQVELGCKLNYLSDLKEPLDWTAFNDPENAAYNENDSLIVTLPIYASSVMNKCLTELGISASSNPLTNKFSIAEFDFSAGYVSVLNDLLISESYCGYLDTNEVLQVFALDQDAGTGPVFTANDIVDLGPIGVGQLPGEAVTVSYSTLKLKQPEPQPTTPEEEEEEEERLALINWEKSVIYTTPQIYYINYVRNDGPNAGLKQVKVYTGVENTYTYTSYRVIRYPISNSFVTEFESKEVVDIRVTRVIGHSITKDSSTATDYAIIGTEYNNAYIELSVVFESFLYDEVGNEIGSEVFTYEPEAFVLSSINFDHVYPASESNSALVPYSASYNLILTEYTKKTSEKTQDYTRDIISTYVKQPFTQDGQQAIALYRENAGSLTIAEAETLAQTILLAPIVHENTTETVSKTGADTAQERPSAAERTNSYYAKGGDPNNGWRTESQADLELALGSATAQRQIELSMPYAPDDTFSGPTGGPFTAVASDAPAKANRYGRVQNRLLLGNRSGINLQLAPERLPSSPYSPLYVQANGLTALYRANATNWAFDSNGIVCSVDALFWAAVGGTGTFWFPVAPGITTLPAAPPIVDGTMNATSTVLPYNETAIYNSLIRLTSVVSKFDYNLTLLTTVPPTPIKIKTTVIKVIVGEVGAFALLGQDSSAVFVQAVPAETGSFILEGQDANLIAPVLPGAVGTFTLSGQPATGGKAISIKVGTAAPTLGSSGAGSFAGWNLIQNASVDDGFVEAGGWPFTFTIDNAGYTSTFVNSNTYITFGAGSEEYTDFSEFNPPLPKMHISSGDGSYQRVATQVGAAPDGRGVARVRYEGRNSLSGTPGSPNIVYELAFYGPRENGDQWIELRVGLHSRTAGVEGPFYLANATTAYMPQVSIVPNSSWVFVGNSTGTSWTRTQNRFIS